MAFLDENKGLGVNSLKPPPPKKSYIPVPVSIMDKLDTGGSLSTLSNPVFGGRENFFFYKLNSSYSMPRKVIGSRRTRLDVILSLSMVFPTRPNVPETGIKQSLFLTM